MDVGEAEALAIQIQNDVQEDVGGLRRDRSMTLSVYYYYGFFLVFFSSMFCVLLYLYRDTWDQSCDVGTKIWSLVWVGRMVAQLICNTLVTAGRVGRFFIGGGAHAAAAAGEAGHISGGAAARRAGGGVGGRSGGTAAADEEETLQEQLQQPQQRVPRWLVFLTRLVHAFGFSWWMLGIDQIFCEPRCPDQTLSHTVSQCMFWITATVYIVPFLLYTLVCLCLPCIIYFMVRLAVRPADRQPTPPSLIQQLEVKTYRDLLETLRREYTIDSQEVSFQQQRRPLAGLSLERVIGGVSTLLATSGATAAATSSSGSDATAAEAGGSGVAAAGGGAPAGEGAAAALLGDDAAAAAEAALPFRGSTGRRGAAEGARDGGGRSSSSRRRLLPPQENFEEGEDVEDGDEQQRQQQRERRGDAGVAARSSQSIPASGISRQSISINKACPICMVDLNDDDQLLIMPCDQRHFFHKACVEHWLETSQACPICRANIVHILTGAPADPAAAQLSEHRDLEMQV